VGDAEQEDPPTVGALELLIDSERRWSRDLAAALRPAATRGEKHRRCLVREALAAYLDLVDDGTRRMEPTAPLRRWPACTLVALADLAAGMKDRAELVASLGPRSRVWLDGWAACSTKLQAVIPADAPGVALLHAAAAPGKRPTRPELRLHIATGALSIVYPEGPGGGRVDAGGGACPTVDGRFVIPRPVPAVTCFDVLGNVERVAVVDIHDPLLVFDADGRVIPAGSPLPADEVWIVHLGEPSAECFEGDARIVEISAPPVGWSRWWLGRVSLAGATAVRSVNRLGGEPRLGPWRTVAVSGHADLELGEPLPHVTDADGDVVYAEVPRLRLPGGGHTEWTIEVRRAGSAAAHRWTAAGGSTVRLSDALPSPVVGRFVVSAHAAGHQPVRAAFTAAEGLSVEADQQVRVLREDGLWPARITVRTPRGAHADPPTVRLRSTEVSGCVTVHVPGQDRSTVLHVSLPHCAVRTRTGGENGPWVVTARSFTIDEAIDGGAIDVRLPRAVVDSVGVPDVLAAAKPDDESGQRIRGRRVTTDVYRYPLASLVDAVRATGSTPLWLLLPGNEVKIATIRGTEPATGARTVGPDLVLDGRGTQPVRVHVRAPFSPWIDVFTADLAPAADRMTLPRAFTGRELRVTVESIDEPGRRHRFDVGGAVALPGDSPAERATSAYLAGRADLPAGDDALPLLWFAAARPAGDLGRLTAHACAARLASTPTTSLLAACRTGLTAAELIEPIIRSGLAEKTFPRVDDPRLVATLFPYGPLPALLLSSPLLPYLAGSPSWPPEELDADEAALLERIKETTSPARMALLRGEQPPEPEEMAGETVPGPLAEAAATMIEQARGFPAAHLFRAVTDRQVSACLLGFALTARLAAQEKLPGAARAAEQQRHAWVELTRQFPVPAARALTTAEYAVAGWSAHHV